MTGITFGQLLQRVVLHRANNGLPWKSPDFETLEGEIEDWICQQLSPKEQIKKCTQGFRTRGTVPWTEVLDFIKTNVHWFVHGAEKVPQEEAERRAKICQNCPLNVGIASGCATCNRTLDAYRKEIVQDSTTLDKSLRACAVCGCDLKSIVHIPLASLQAKGDKEFPKWCWQAKQDPAHTGSRDKQASVPAASEVAPTDLLPS